MVQVTRLPNHKQGCLCFIALHQLLRAWVSWYSNFLRNVDYIVLNRPSSFKAFCTEIYIHHLLTMWTALRLCIQWLYISDCPGQILIKNNILVSSYYVCPRKVALEIACLQVPTFWFVNHYCIWPYAILTICYLDY